MPPAAMLTSRRQESSKPKSPTIFRSTACADAPPEN
jgi:hypothetical protein